jgi:hypothetical protein
LFYVASVGLFLGIFIELFCAPESFGSWMHKNFYSLGNEYLCSHYFISNELIQRSKTLNTPDSYTYTTDPIIIYR